MSAFRSFVVACVALGFCAASALSQEANEPAPAPSVAQLKALAAQVQARLIADRVVGAQPITAKTEKDVVALEGTVGTEQQRARISILAAREAGKMAEFVANRVRVKAVEVEAATNTTGDAPQAAAPTGLDQEQLDKLRAVIAEALPQFSKRINLVFRVDPIPTILVEGVLNTYDEKLELNRLIRQNYHGLAILNNVRVHSKPETPATAGVEDAKAVAADPGPKVAITVDKDTPRQDRKLAEQVALTLRQDKRLIDVAIVVQADYDVIWLRGSVQSNQQKVLAVVKSDAVEGVEYVIDNLSVDPSPKGQEAASLDDADVEIYVRNYFTRRVGISVIDVKISQETILVILEDDFVDQEERQIAQKSVSDLEKELGRKIQVELQKTGLKSDSLR
ncbi:MAG TPA: BON domain-containing protein [Pirellulaceae bacterium]|nr:BON domain-containing protein [Pirellulaceae bacterium]